MRQHVAEPAAFSPAPFVLPAMRSAHLAQLVDVWQGVKMALEKTREACWFSPSGIGKRQSHISQFSANVSCGTSLHVICNVGRFGMNEAFFRFSRNWLSCFSNIFPSTLNPPEKECENGFDVDLSILEIEQLRFFRLKKI